ncbi:MAG: NFACT family protein [Candidatus Micrarchaeota archaeon]
MQAMSNLDYLFLCRELGGALAGAFLNKVYEPRPRVLRLKFHKNGELNLLVELGNAAYLTSRLEEPPKTPSHFASLLRKKLGNAVVAAVEQLNFDRLFQIRFRAVEGEFSLVFEMFGKGNTVLCTGDGAIAAVYRQEQFAARSLKARQKYLTPPSEKKNPFEMDAADFSELSGKLVSALSKEVNLAPFYLEEACARAGIAFDADASCLSAEQKKALLKAFASLSRDFAPSVYCAEGSPTAVAPFKLAKLGGAPCMQFGSFSQALEEYYSAAPRKAAAPRAREIAALKHALAQQEKALVEAEEGEKALRGKAVALEAGVEKAGALLEAFAGLKRKKKSDSEIARELGVEVRQGKLVADF